MHKPPLLLLALCLCVSVVQPSTAPAQTIPKEREIRYREQSLYQYEPFKAEELWKRIKIPPSPALSPQEALKSFRVAPEFIIETVAAEPLVENPVMFEFDPDGRIWAVELRGYMRDINGTGEGDPIGRVVVLEDTNGDTIMDKATPFLDKLVMARTVSFVQGGVLVQEPPNLWFCEDTDGDLKCDRKRLVGKFGVPGDPQHTDNALFHALDNWMYNAKSAVRHKFIGGKLIEEPTFFRGQWGVTQDDFGRLYYGYESSPLHVDLAPAELMHRNRHFQHDLSGNRNSYGLNVSIGWPDREIFPIRVAPGITLGGNELRSDGTLRTFTIAAGPSIYRGDQFPPQYYGCAVLPEAGGNLVRLSRLTSDDGVHITCRNAFGKQEWVASTDERFRPVNSRTGPDGAVYVCDMYKGIIEHVVFMMPYLRNQIQSRGLEQPVNQGRIYRIRHKDRPLGPRPKLSRASNEELVQHLSHPNGWWRDTAQRLLVEREAVNQTEALRTLATTGERPLGRLHALWTLEGIRQLDWPTVRKGIVDVDAMVRATAVRLAPRLRNKDNELDMLRFFIAAAVREKHPQVEMQLLLALGGFHSPTAQGLMTVIVSHRYDELFYAAAVSGLQGSELEFIEILLRAPAWQEDAPKKRGLLAMLAMAVFNQHDAARVGRLLELADEQIGDQKWRRDEIVRGVLSSQLSRTKWPEPLVLPGRPGVLDALQQASDPGIKKRAAQLLAVVTWPGDTTARVKKPQPRPLTKDEQRQFNLGKSLYAVTCFACHQENGRGQAGKAPPLAESDWVIGPPERLVKIALHGVAGPIQVGEQTWNLSMPGLGQAPILNDQRMAAVLTYVRRAWDNWGDPIEPQLVASIRKETAGRSHPWTAQELLHGKQLQGGTPDTNKPPVAPPAIDPLTKYQAALRGGDAEKGRVLFHTNLKLRCVACHKIGQQGGGFVGPELTEVGGRSTREHLLESLLDPSRTIAKGFDTLLVLTKDGRSFSGTFVFDDGQQLTIAPPSGGTSAIPTTEIEDRYTSPISSMPPVGDLFTGEELSHLVAYLASLKKQ